MVGMMVMSVVSTSWVMVSTLWWSVCQEITRDNNENSHLISLQQHAGQVVQHLPAHGLIAVHVAGVAEHWLQQLPLLPHPPADPDAEDLLAEAGEADLDDPGEVGELVGQTGEVGVDLPVLSVSLQGTARVALGPVPGLLAGPGRERTPTKEVVLTPGTSSQAGEVGLASVGEGDLAGSPSSSAA